VQTYIPIHVTVSSDARTACNHARARKRLHACTSSRTHPRMRSHARILKTPELDGSVRQALLKEYCVSAPTPTRGAAHTAVHKVTMAAKALGNSRAQLPPERVIALRHVVAAACGVTEAALTEAQIAEAAVPRALVRCEEYTPEAEAIMAQVFHGWPSHICTGTGAHPLPRRHRHWAYTSHICPGTGARRRKREPPVPGRAERGRCATQKGLCGAGGSTS